MKSKVSVIVPIYNCEKMIDQTLKRLVDQSLNEIEIICVNDGSTDGSLKVLEQWTEKDERIKIVNQKNGGLSAARNTGIRNASSPYLMFCDGDDLFDRKMCEIMFDAIEREDVDIVACGTEVKYDVHSEIASSDRKYYRVKFSGKKYIDDEIMEKTDVSVCDKIFRADLIKKHSIKFPDGLNNEDYYFYNAYMSIAKKIFFVNQKLYTYIRHNDSIMSENFEGNSYSPDHLLVVKELFKFYEDNGFIKGHVDFFWNQFLESYWFSYNHSAKKYRGKINKIAKNFAKEILQKYPVNNPIIRRQLNEILHNNMFYRMAKGAKNRINKFYSKINIAYRQQDYINKNIEQLEQDICEMSDKLSKWEK